MRVVIGRKKRHSTEEIVTKLAQADDLVIRGKPQGEIARTLGISIMTLHRWRKKPPESRRASLATYDTSQPDRMRAAGDRIAQLQLENSRLRRLVTDLLLEKMKLEEAAQSKRIFRRKDEIGRLNRFDPPGEPLARGGHHRAAHLADG